MHLRGVAGPTGGAFGQAEVFRDSREAVAGGPAHHGRKRVHPGAAAQFPQTGIGLVVAAPGLLAERFEAAEQRFVAAPGQALVEKDVGRGEDGRSILMM
jgi:hypothetical protein